MRRPNFPCSVCNKKFSRAEHMRRHKQEVHLSFLQGQGDHGLRALGQKVLDNRDDNIRDMTKALVDHLRKSGESEANICRVEQIMYSKLYEHTSDQSSAAFSPALHNSLQTTPSGSLAAPSRSSSPTLPGTSSQALPWTRSQALPGTSSRALPGTSSQALPVTSSRALTGPSSATLSTSSPYSPASFSFNTPSGSASTLQQVFGRDSENLQLVNLDRGENVIKLPADQSYLLVPVQPKVTVSDEPRQQKRATNHWCEPCEKSFRDKFNLEDHNKKVHGKRAKPLECERFFCHALFTSLLEKKEHMASCFWVCPEPECTRTGLKWKQEVISHQQSHARKSAKLARIAQYLAE